MDNQKNQDTPTRSSNMEKAEGDRKSEWGEGTSEGAGASNRPMGEENVNPASTPERGVGTPDTTQGNR
jgi:hypothetical protein